MSIRKASSSVSISSAGAKKKRRGKKKMCDFVLFGGKGFIGGEILKALEAQNYKVQIAPSALRLENSREEIKQYLKAQFPISHGVIVAAGCRGNPNIDWCKTHPVETIDANIVGTVI